MYGLNNYPTLICIRKITTNNVCKYLLIVYQKNTGGDT